MSFSLFFLLFHNLGCCVTKPLAYALHLGKTEISLGRCQHEEAMVLATHHAHGKEGCIKLNLQNCRNQMSLVVRKPVFCICENKDADQRLCFRNTDSAIPLLFKSEFSSSWPSSVVVQPGLCQTWSETPKTGFLTTRLI